MVAGRFVVNPQPVEIHHRGIWYSGELLGWRPTPDGRVAVRVRCTVDGLRRSTWKDLAELRLPDPAHPPRREPFPAVSARPTGGPPASEADQTRPHALLAALSTRQRPPAHAVTPPARPAAPTSAVAVVPSAEHRLRPSAPLRPRPTPYRRASPQADEWSRDWLDTRPRDERLSSV